MKMLIEDQFEIALINYDLMRRQVLLSSATTLIFKECKLTSKILHTLIRAITKFECFNYIVIKSTNDTYSQSKTRSNVISIELAVSRR